MEDYSSIGEPSPSYSNSISNPDPFSLYSKIQAPPLNKKEFNSLPKLNNSQQLDIYRLFCLHANLNNIIAKIPTTLLRISNTNLCYLVQNNKYGAIITRLCSDEDFFAGVPEKNGNDNPVCCYKVLGKRTQFLYTKESAMSLWSSSTETSDKMQIFIQPRTKPSSLTRVHWRIGGRTKFFLISNKTKPVYKRKTEDKRTRSITMTPKNFRSTMSLSILKGNDRNSIDCLTPATERLVVDRCPSLKNFRNLGNSTDRFSAEEQVIETNQNPIINTKVSDGILVIEDTVKVPEIESMLEKIINFLRKQAYKDEELREITFDFIYGKDRKWVFLDCVEVSLKNSEIKLELGEINLGEVSQVKRAISFPDTKAETNSDFLKALNMDQSPEITIEGAVMYPFMKNSPPRPSKTMHTPQLPPISNSKHVKIEEKSDPAMTLKPSNLARIKNLKQQSFKVYEKRSSTRKRTIILQDPQLKKSKTEDFHDKNDFYNTSKSLWDDTYDVHIKRCFMDAIRKIDEMNMNTELLKVKSRNLVETYGGDDFWNKFIMALYKRIFSSEELSKYFSSSNLKMITKGMLRVFNGCATFEFRREIRLAHEKMGITEREFNLYSQLFEDTLTQFGINEVDKHVIMTQIRSMKCLICKAQMP
ncbi:unnamed protein product [Blepharisma stoltei]|uniref:Uncharacterized protein n=1 Tax=Blepharisma stoltei TaxID=1481888 RepID=A0AAU9JBT8_9CILI|nr:unnamed protein product [Blepharisma stoltei]